LWIGLLLVALLAGGTYWWLTRQKVADAPRFVTEQVRRGALTLTVTANGTLQPTRAVNIGTSCRARCGACWST